MQGRAAGLSSSITLLISEYFDKLSFDDIDDTLSDLLQIYICPDPEYTRTPECIANAAFQLHQLSTLLRKLEALALDNALLSLDSKMKGDISC